MTMAQANNVTATKRPVTRIAWRRSHRRRSDNHPAGKADKSQDAIRLLIGTGPRIEKTMDAANRATATPANHWLVDPIGRTRATATDRTNVAAYQNGMTCPSRLASDWAALACVWSSSRLRQG